MDGPSADRLRLVLRQSQLVHQMANDTVLLMPRREVLWEGRSDSSDKWLTASVLYSHGQPHQVNRKSKKKRNASASIRIEIYLSICLCVHPSVGVWSGCRQLGAESAASARTFRAGQCGSRYLEGRRKRKSSEWESRYVNGGSLPGPL